MTRCPYCHCDVTGREPIATCLRCEAQVHPGCALELTRCGACGGEGFTPFGGGDVDGWRLVDAGAKARESHAAFLEVLPRYLPAVESTESESLSLRLDLLRRELRVGALLAGEAVLTVPQATRLGGLTLELREERARSGLVGVRKRSRRLRCVRLLGVGERRGLLRYLVGPRVGLYAPGIYRVRFRLPLSGVPTTEERPGEAQRRITAVLRLAQPRGALYAGLEVRVLPPGRAPVRGGDYAFSQRP